MSEKVPSTPVISSRQSAPPIVPPRRAVHWQRTVLVLLAACATLYGAAGSISWDKVADRLGVSTSKVASVHVCKHGHDPEYRDSPVRCPVQPPVWNDGPDWVCQARRVCEADVQVTTEQDAVIAHRRLQGAIRIVSRCSPRPTDLPSPLSRSTTCPWTRRTRCLMCLRIWQGI